MNPGEVRAGAFCSRCDYQSTSHLRTNLPPGQNLTEGYFWHPQQSHLFLWYSISSSHLQHHVQGLRGAMSSASHPEHHPSQSTTSTPTAPGCLAEATTVQLFLHFLQHKEFLLRPQKTLQWLEVEAPRWPGNNSRQRMSLFTHFTDLHAEVQVIVSHWTIWLVILLWNVYLKRDHNLAAEISVCIYNISLPPRPSVTLKIDFLLTRYFLICISLMTKVFYSHAHEERCKHYYKLKKKKMHND